MAANHNWIDTVQIISHGDHVGNKNICSCGAEWITDRRQYTGYCPVEERERCDAEEIEKKEEERKKYLNDLLFIDFEHDHDFEF